MANRFEGFTLESEEQPKKKSRFSDFQLESARTSPLTDEERLIVQNFFDTQPERRKSYMKKLGFELDPKDENKYRPLGSKDKFENEIDPGISKYFGPGGLKELALDAGDIAYDSSVNALMLGAGATGGAAAGAAGGPIGVVVGGMLGGSFGNAASEVVKKEVGDLFLDENIPADMSLVAAQSLITGSLPILAKGGKALKASFVKSQIESRKKAIINAASSSGGGVTPEILDKAARNPDLFLDKAKLSQATERLAQLRRDIFGTAEGQIRNPTSFSGESVFGRAMNPLNDAAEKEMISLSKNRAADFTADELTAPLKMQVQALTSSKLVEQMTPDERAAVKFLQQEISDINSAAAKKGVFDFSDARKFLDKVQDQVFENDALGQPKLAGARHLRQAFGGGGTEGFDNGLRSLLDQKALNAGSQLPEINAKRSQIMRAHNTAVEAFTPTNLQSAFLSDNPNDIKKFELQSAAKIVDDTLGTQLANSIQDTSVQRVINNLYENPKAFGSGQVLPEIVARTTRGAMKGAIVGGAGGGALGGVPGGVVGGVGGGLLGAAKGAADAQILTSPTRALTELGTLSRQGDVLDQFLARPAGEQILQAPSVLRQVDAIRSPGLLGEARRAGMMGVGGAATVETGAGLQELLDLRDQIQPIKKNRFEGFELESE